MKQPKKLLIWVYPKFFHKDHTGTLLMLAKEREIEELKAEINELKARGKEEGNG